MSSLPGYLCLVMQTLLPFVIGGLSREMGDPRTKQAMAVYCCCLIINTFTIAFLVMK